VSFLLLSGGGNSWAREDGSSNGMKARIAVGRIVNNTEDIHARIQRENLEQAARIKARINASVPSREEMDEYHNATAEYSVKMGEWMKKANEVGYDKAGPPPAVPKAITARAARGVETHREPQVSAYTDPVAGALRDMLTNALFNSGRFIVLERQGLDQIDREQANLQGAAVGGEDSVSAGQVQGAELILMGSLNTLQKQASGGSVGATNSDIEHTLPGLFGFDVPMAEETEQVEGEWKTAKVAMEIRLIDSRTSAVVAATTIEGSGTSVRGGYSRTDYTFNAGPLPQGFSVYSNTPIEDAFRKMIDAGVEYIVTNTPASYYHHTH
jgi:curli biogenesis system outer membrane secretion channel CsgG